MTKLLFLLLLGISILAQPTPSIEAYNQFISAKMIHISKATYDVKDQSLCTTCESTFTTHRVLKKSDLLALIGYDSALKAVVVAFRGSDNLKNWVIDDARITLIQYSQCINCKVHKGFLRAYEAIVGAGLRHAVEEAIAKYTPDSIYYTGHSLGGAMASIAALKLEEEGYARGIKLLVYTFGQPRVGNRRFARYHQLVVKNNYRVVHNKDIVPHKPSYVFKFRHAGNEVWYKPSMTDIRELCESQSDNCSNSIGDLPHSYSAADHGSANYVLLYDRIISS